MSFVVTSDAGEHFLSIIQILARKTSDFLYEDSRDLGRKCERSWTNVFCFAPTVMPKCTMALRSFREESRLKNEVNSGKPSRESAGNPEPSLDESP